ncbi:hypothetical protein OAF13_02610 [Akkermansiaceae bacterium]|nr:hypothetical protein [Akkermansiaceae bacterium]
MRTIILSLTCALAAAAAQANTLSFPGTKGKPGNGKHIVLIAGDDEYRSEESCPMLAKILSKHHGFKTTVLFSQNKEGGFIDANSQKNIPGTEAVNTADFLILGLRFRDLPDDQLKPLADYLNAGKPVFGFRTSTHGFRTKSKLGGINWGNLGPDVLGEGWAGHYGGHGSQGARGVINEPHTKHPILNGVSDVFAESDVYGVRRVTKDNATILVHGVVTEALVPESADVKGKQPQPAVWLKKYQTPQGKKGTALCTTMGSSCDLDNEGLRRIFINAAFHFTGLEVPSKVDVSFVDPFDPSRFSFLNRGDHFKKLNLKPADFGYGKSPQITEPASVLISKSAERWKASKSK